LKQSIILCIIKIYRYIQKKDRRLLHHASLEENRHFHIHFNFAAAGCITFFLGK